ncbi:HAD hydrolase-like protein [Candidatus Pacearchaeota archaeon]|nr:HAD hydrolase-like protein [Candidatus Pacearchaeota archaeon]
MSERKVFLFDIDGTLISSPEFLKDYSTQLREELSSYFARPLEVDFSGLHGNTERKNLRIILERQGINPSENQFDEFFKEFGDNYLVSSKNLILLPWVSETIKELSDRHLLGLVTGNQEIVARKRLESVRLNKYFPFGSFGNEDYERSNLVRNALNRAREYGWERNKSNVYLVGDTTKDVEAGKIEGVITVAVATGSASKDELSGLNPDYIISNLSEIRQVLYSSIT